MFELVHLVFFFSGGFAAFVRQLASWINARGIAVGLILFGHSRGLLCAQRDNPAATHEQQRQNPDPEHAQSHQRPAPAGCNTRRMISCASTAASASNAFSAAPRSRSISALAACTCCCALRRASF